MNNETKNPDESGLEPTVVAVEPPNAFDHYYKWRLENNAMLLRIEGIVMAIESSNIVMQEVIRLVESTEDEELYRIREGVKYYWNHINDLVESLKKEL